MDQNSEIVSENYTFVSSETLRNVFPPKERARDANVAGIQAKTAEYEIPVPRRSRQKRTAQK